MSDKVIAVMDKPINCQNCVWGICKYSFPLSIRRKGYTCQLKGIEDRIVDDFDYEADVHLEDCPLVSVEEHDKKIRDRAIEEFAEKLHELCGYEENDYQYPYLLHESRIDEIAEQMKEVE